MPSNLCLATLTVPKVPEAISRIFKNSSSYLEMLISETLSLFVGPLASIVSSSIKSFAAAAARFCISNVKEDSKLPLLLKNKNKLLLNMEIKIQKKSATYFELTLILFFIVEVKVYFLQSPVTLCLYRNYVVGEKG